MNLACKTMTTIMIVDDSASLRAVLGELLSCSGYHVLSAVHGQEALAKAATEQVDLVLCDVNMPVMGGIEFVSQFIANERHAQVPVIMLTTEADSALKTAAKQAGAKGWVIKPYNDDQLLKTIDTLLS